MRVGLCFRHFSSWSQQLPHGGMQQECQRQLPGIRESLCGNRRGWRREQVKEVWQWIARFARCPAHITEQVNSRAWVKSLKHSKVHREEVKKTTTVFASRPVSIWVLCLSGLSAPVQIINWNIDVATDWHTYPSTAEMCVCSINRLLWAYRYLKAGTVRQRWASRCNSIHSCTARDSQGSILIWGMPFEDEDLLWCYLMMFWWVFLPTSHNTVNSYFHLSDIQLWFRSWCKTLHNHTENISHQKDKYIYTGGTSGGATHVEMHKHGGVHVRAGACFEAGNSQTERQTVIQARQ